MSTIEASSSDRSQTSPTRDASSVSAPAEVTRRQLAAAATIGAVAALVASAVMLWAGRAWGGVILAQLLANRMTGIVPVSLFGRALGALEANAKPLTIVALTLLQMVIGAVIAVGYARVARQHAPRRAVGALALTGGIWLLLALVAAPLGSVGLFALDAPGGAWPTLGIFLLAAVVFGLLVAASVPGPMVRAADAWDPTRRRLTGQFGVATLALLALAAGGYTGDFVRSVRRKTTTTPAAIAPEETDAGAGPFAFAGMPHEITPTDEFYVVSKNFVDPTVDSAGWTLEVSGMVDRPLSLSYSDLITRPTTEFTSTLECISNPVGGKYISNAVWQGFTLKSLLDEAGLQPGVVDLELHAADGYVESIPLAEALAADTMVVHTINGERLPDEHGFPARLIVPGIFGMKNVKWIEKIVAMNHDVQGFWQERGWSDVATVLTMSRIDTPRSGAKAVVGRPIRIGGVAFAGDRGISRVEVSFDSGATWQEAALSDPLSGLSWRLWAIQHTPVEPGNLWVTVRATDGAGQLQTAVEAEPLPDGATGYHRIRVAVSAPDAVPTPTATTPGN
jgi:DMSO/TMAO reductase YedYZ molybdopterin-dependent catalytic subunit